MVGHAVRSHRGLAWLALSIAGMAQLLAACESDAEAGASDASSAPADAAAPHDDAAQVPADGATPDDAAASLGGSSADAGTGAGGAAGGGGASMGTCAATFANVADANADTGDFTSDYALCSHTRLPSGGVTTCYFHNGPKQTMTVSFPQSPAVGSAAKFEVTYSDNEVSDRKWESTPGGSAGMDALAGNVLDYHVTDVPMAPSPTKPGDAVGTFEVSIACTGAMVAGL